MITTAAPFLLAALLLGPAGGSDAAVTLAERVVARHQHVADLHARFTQTYRSGALGREMVERGELWLKQPGRMLWEYQSPEKKTFVADGKTFYFYVPADHQVIVREQAGARGLPALLLSGQGNLLEDFAATLEAPPAPGRQRLLLKPRKEDPEIERVFLDVDADGRILGIDVIDAQGNRSRFEFQDVKENVGVPDGRFRFQVPAGAEVVSG